jgi:cyclohexadienyl dehydratase
VRCADVARFPSIEAIDKPGVKVIANPGGGNVRFARANFKTATITIYSDNIGIFNEVLTGKADVFVTESAEALVQQKLVPGLCAVNPDKPLQNGEMGYMLPRGDTITKAYVDQWLHLIKANGEYQRIANRWLN